MMDLHELMSLPGGKTLEFKRDLSSLKPILKTLVAFANTAGGTLLLGRDDNGVVVGISDVFAAEEKLINAIADSVYPPFTMDPRRKNALINKRWPAEIQCFTEEREILQTILEQMIEN